MTAPGGLARTDRDTAWQLLIVLPSSCRTLDHYEGVCLLRIGIPAGFLPSARELSRGDLA